jgi:signal transduction histidine kinase
VGLPRLRPLPGILLAVTVLGELGAVGLSWGLEPAYDTLFSALFTLLTVGVGALILSRHPRHVIGWLLCVLGLVNALTADLPQGWGLRAAAEGWAWGPLTEWLGLATFLLQGPVLVAILLLFPSGHLPNRRWSTVVWLSVAGGVIGATGFALDPDTGRYFVGGRNPYVVPGLPTDALFAVGLALIAVAMAGALVAVVNRLRRSSGVERQQMKWFALSSGFVVVALPLSAALWAVTRLVHPLPVIALTVWPVAIGVAILRYRLYDVDLVISRAFTGAVLTVVLALVYVGSTLVIGAIAGGGSPWATAVSTLLAAAAFKVLHQRVQRRVDSRFRPERHAALSRVGEFLEALRAEQVEPEQVVEVLRSALGDPMLELWFVLQPDEPAVDERGRPVPDGLDGARESFAVERGGITLGQVVWLPRTEEQRALLPSVVAAAGLAIEMARLRVELRRRLEEVEASRARLAAVADEERHRLERDLHDGAQQRLVSIGLALRHAQHQIGSDSSEASKTLDGAVAEVAATIDELRELAHGLHPTALQAGLGPALRELVSRVPVAVEVATTPDRYPPDIEAAAYFVACEGLANAVKHAQAERIALRVARHDSRLVVSVADDGMGGADADAGSGLLGLSDRVAAQGGTLHIDSVRGRGTRITAELPCAS